MGTLEQQPVAPSGSWCGQTFDPWGEEQAGHGRGLPVRQAWFRFQVPFLLGGTVQAGYVNPVETPLPARDNQSSPPHQPHPKQEHRK